MMSKTKFRGQRVDTKEWVCGGYHKHIKRQISPIGDSLKEDDIVHLIIQSGFADWNMPKPLQTIEVIPETVGQFTGLYDKNGEEIWGGDIVKYSYESNGEIKNKIYMIIYDSGCFYCKEYNNPFSSSVGYYTTLVMGNGLEVIGNIYDNQDLLDVMRET